MRTNANGKRDRDGLIISALAGGASYAQAARVGGVSKATVSRRMAEPGFRGRVLEEREQTIDRVRGLLVDGSLAAARSILQLAEAAESESARLTAASRVLDLALRRRPGFETLSMQEFREVVVRIVDLSLARMPEEEHLPYIHEVRAIGAR